LPDDNKPKTDPLIRPMTHQDIHRVMQMERAIFSDPWPTSAFEEQLSGEGWGAIVAEIDGAVIGYACYLTVENEGHLTNIAVDPAYQRKSVAKQLLNTILVAVSQAGCEYLLLEVRPSNFGAVAFYERYDFSLLYRRRNYYRRPVEDALVMVRHLTPETKDA